MSKEALKPCPFCGVELIANNNPADLYVQRYGTHYQHPENNCYLSEDEVTPSKVAEWNDRAALSLLRAELEEGGEAEPIDMLLFCPDCGEQHIDAPEPGGVDLDSPGGLWLNPPHKSHLCHGCGCIWRPANVPTNGIACGVVRGKGDTWLLGDGAIPTAPASLEALIRACYDDAARYPEMEDPRTGDWMYDDNSDCAEAIRKRGEETAREYVARLAASPVAADTQGDAKDAARASIDASHLINELEYAVLARSQGLTGSAEKLSDAKQAIRAALSPTLNEGKKE